MCGIFGYLDHQTQKTPDDSKLRETSRLLSHRGPDHQAVFGGPSIGLVHTRLSLVDLDPRSNQPFWDKSGRWALVFNGEIYNYKELRSELEKKGVSFRTSGDTEVLLECLLRGDVHQTLLKLEGMFAFALYDTQERSLLLARDRIGMKPLFIYEDGSRFVFSSEIGAMKPWIPWEADTMMVAPYLHGLHDVTEGYSLYKGVKSAVPGSFIKVKAGAKPEYGHFFTLSDFWDKAEQEKLRKLNPNQAVDLIEEKLLTSVRLQLQADAPLGVFCSGGVDSSLIAGMVAKLHSDLTLFHSNIVGPGSEYKAAKALADHLKLRFVAHDVTDENYLEKIPDVMERAEYPFRHLPTSPAFLMLSEAVSAQGVKGVLTGEASDECFLGYPAYAPDLLKWLSQTPRNSFRFMKRALKGFPPPWRDTSKGLVSRFHQHFRDDLENEDIRAAILKKTGKKLNEKEFLPFHDFSHNIRSLCHRNDSMGMAAGLESRFPFLDSDLIRTAVNLPKEYKLRFSPAALDPQHLFIQDKWIIRKLADRYMPRALSRRIKIGWPTTFLTRMEIKPEFFIEQGCLKEWLNLSEREIRYFMGQAPQHLHTTLMYLEIWAHVCFYGHSKESMRKKMKTHIRVKPEVWKGARRAA